MQLPLLEVALVGVPAYFEEPWKYTTLTFASAGVWALTRHTGLQTAATSLLIANALMYRLCTRLWPFNTSDWYWHVFLPLFAWCLYRVDVNRGSAGARWDYSLPIAFALLYSSLIFLGILDQYSYIHCNNWAMKAACMAMYSVLTVLAVRLLHW